MPFYRPLQRMAYPRFEAIDQSASLLRLSEPAFPLPAQPGHSGSQEGAEDSTIASNADLRNAKGRPIRGGLCTLRVKN